MTAPIALNGSCVCGRIRFTLAGGFGKNVICFCTNCRKMTGSLFMANTFVPKAHYTITSGKPDIRTYSDSDTDSGGTVERSFCGECGSSLFSTNEKFADGLIVAVGTLDRTPEQEWIPETELFVKNKESWLQTEGGNQKAEMTGFYRDDGKGLGSE